MIYCDTSLLIAALTEEKHSEAAARWLVDQERATLVVSHWVTTELASGLAMKVRTGDLDEPARARAMNAWRTISKMSFDMAPVRPDDFRLAVDLLERPTLPLRAADALHVAIAINNSFSLATLDKVMAGSAVLAGVEVEAVLEQG